MSGLHAAETALDAYMPATHSPPPPFLTSPSPHLRQHAHFDAPQIDGEAFRPYWWRRAPIDCLLESRAISPWQWRIAVEFRALFEDAHRGQLQAHDPGRIKVDGGRLGGREPSEGRLAALERLTRLRTELGEGTFGLVVVVVVDDTAVACTGRLSGAGLPKR